MILFEVAVLREHDGQWKHDSRNLDYACFLGYVFQPENIAEDVALAEPILLCCLDFCPLQLCPSR